MRAPGGVSPESESTVGHRIAEDDRRSVEPGVSRTIVLEARFKGPPSSANGGYACGITAAALDVDPCQVTLRRPPPLGRPLERIARSGAAELWDGAELVATAQPAPLELELPAAVSFDEASSAAAAFDARDYAARHPYPECFTCGPHRSPGDGLRIFPASIERPGWVVAWPWVPEASLAADDDRIDPLMLWAALDCPSGMAGLHRQPPPSPHVLGRMTVQILRRPEPGERLVVAGWLIGEEGRKRFAGSALWSAEGEALAKSRATWIALDEAQRERFQAIGNG